jgi:FlaA1/EpsC-like NDP-sugar epimerase
VWENVHTVPHIALAEAANFFLIAPATADLIARLAAGRADDLLTNLVLASDAPKMLVPAMHPSMWLDPATVANVETLRTRGFLIMDPDVGRLTGKDSGPGRFPEGPAIIERFDAVTGNIQDLKGKRVLVTGAAGSIGSDIVRQVLQFKPAQLILLDQAESPLYELERELRDVYQYSGFEVVVGDIRNKARMLNVFTTFRPEYIFHAAAYKHVPLMESNPSEALLTNVKGTKILADLSVEFNALKFVMVSTDKAVKPTNVMGASKRIAEIYVQALNRISATKFITTRFGNVLGSNGSVIPILAKQIERGGPVTVTHPEITRYFMTIEEACLLVLEAGAYGEGGEILLFDMGKSVRIKDLVEKMIKLSGLSLGKDISIVYTGLRPGEKLYEELLNDQENTVKTHHSRIMKALVQEFNFQEVSEQISDMIPFFEAQDNREIVKRMKKLVPEYKSQNSEFEALD